MGNVMFGRGVVDAAASDGAAVGKGGGGAAGFCMARLEQAPAKGESTMSANKMPSKRSASVGCMVVAARRSGIIQTYMYVCAYEYMWVKVNAFGRLRLLLVFIF